jgi:predicted secreted hydrolase
MHTRAHGTIVNDGARIEVTGASWTGHEFGTGFLAPLQRGRE